MYVRTEGRTHGQVLAVMPAFLIRRELNRVWRGLNVTVDEGLGSVGDAVLDRGQSRRRRKLTAHSDAALWSGRRAESRLGVGNEAATPPGDPCSHASQAAVMTKSLLPTTT